jgi:pseudaminic acid cytidylyltransferase
MAIAQGAGAEVPFRRPVELSDDFTGTLPVIAHAVKTVEAAGGRHDIVCCAYPAAVLVSAADYHAALSSLNESRAEYVFSAARYSYPIQRALRQKNGHEVELFFPEHAQTRSQDLEPAYHDAGQFYIGRRDAWLEQRPILAPHSRIHLLPADRVQDIDTMEDWDRAERLWLLQRSAATQSGARANR